MGGFHMRKEAYNFVITYADGSIYQGRVFAPTFGEAMQKIMADLPSFPGDPEPVRFVVEMKQG